MLFNAAKKLNSGRKFQNASRLPGLHIFPDFVSPEEEAQLIQSIEQTRPPFRISNWNGKHWNKEWGTKIRFIGTKDAANGIDDASQSVPLPPFLQLISDRFTNGDYLPTAAFVPNNCNAIKYQATARGHYLGPHVDDRNLSGILLANISLLSNCTMVYVHERTQERVDVHLPRRSLQVVTGESRYSWKHSIPLNTFEGDVRYSLTFRKQGSATAPVVSGM